MRKTDVCIIGAGPAGSTLAHFLAREGVDHVVLDKSEFPRDKICGDGITVDVLNVLRRIDPELLRDFAAEADMRESWGFCFHAPSGKELRYDFSGDNLPYAPFFTSRRLHLDNFLVEKLPQQRTQLITGAEVNHIKRIPGGLRVGYSGLQEEELECKILIGAEGEKPIVTRQLGLEHYRAKPHLIAAIRVYYRNVQGFNPNGHLEFFFDKDLLPGYFWAFPLSNNEANVGLGMVSTMIAKKRINLRRMLGQVINKNPRIAEMFKYAEPMEDPRGWGLPIITPKRQIAGESYALIGDAAGMIEPFTGKGIGPGMMSARICSEHIIRALREKNYDLRSYQQHMYRYYSGEIRTGYTLQKSLRYPLALNTVLSMANLRPVKNWSHNKMVREWCRWL